VRKWLDMTWHRMRRGSRLFSRPRHAAVTSESYRAGYAGVGAAV